MLGDLFEISRVREAESAAWLIEPFMKGYGKVEDDVAFKAAIHVGAHLVCWITRGPPTRPPGIKERGESLLSIGRDFIIKGWEKDRNFFEGTVLSPLFA
jgi:hypothetical protein